MPDPVALMASGVVRGKLHVAGGGTEHECEVARRTLKVYDPVTDKWSAGTSMSRARLGPTAGVAGSGLHPFHVFGGQGVGGPITGEVEAYSPLF
jgi:hypothetical protein